MADISLPRTKVKRVAELARRAVAAADRVLHGQLAGSITVAAVAVALAVTRIELQYVTGAFLIVFAQRLSQKKFTSYAVLPPEPPRRKHEDVFGKLRDTSMDALER